GDADLLITRHYFSPQLWRNNGDLQFQNISAEAGLEQDFTNYWGAAFCDYDHDGCLDLFLAKYHFNSSPFSNQKSVLYRNDCNGGFIDVTTEAGIVFPARPSFQPVFADFNHDGWEDLYIIIDKSDYPNELFINNTDGTFNQVTESSGAGIMISAMTGAIGDYDNDGDLDVFVSNDPVPHNILLQNNGIAEFSDVTGSAGLIEKPVYPSWGGPWIDCDNDTWQDLFYGTVTSPQSPPTGNRFFVNHFPDIFSDQSQLLGIHDEMTESFVCAKGDVNNDGYYDFYTNNQAPYPSQLYLNNGGENNYLAVSLQGTYSNPDGIGSWIHCFVNGEKFVRFTTCGENFVGQDSKRQIFGL